MRLSNCELPGGFVDISGQVHKRVKLRGLTGKEEEMLLSDPLASNAEKISALISQCVQSIGSIDRVTEDIARECLAADRQYLAMKLRQITFGDTIDFSVSCPWQDCGERVDISFSLSQVDIEDANLNRLLHEWKMAEDETSRLIRFRLPNGSDQEALNSLAFQDEEQALTTLLWRCIQSIDGLDQFTLEDIASLPDSGKNELQKYMHSLAPDMEINIRAKCAECDREFDLPFDIQDFFLRELNINHEVLMREVHYLAFYYHWSEQEILNMTRQKRRQYIQTLSEEIERMNESVNRYVAA